MSAAVRIVAIGATTYDCPFFRMVEENSCSSSERGPQGPELLDNPGGMGGLEASQCLCF